MTKSITLWLFRAAFVLLLGLAWSCQDEFTDEDLLNLQDEIAQDSIQLSVVVYNGSTSFKGSAGGREASAKGISGLNVAVTDANGTVRSSATDANGIAIFPNLNPGSVSGMVSGTGFTTANFVVSLLNNTNLDPGGSSSNNGIQAGVLIPVYETSGPNTATVGGRATCELDLLNDTRENVPDGTKVAFTISTSSIDFDDSEEAIGALLGVLTQITSSAFSNAKVISIAYETNFVANIAGGAYTITLPTSAEGLAYEFSFSDFRADQSIAINNYRNSPSGSTRDVITLSTVFSQNSIHDSGFPGANPIPFLYPIQIDIAAPPAAGSGAAVTARLLPQAVAPTFTILAVGSGYPASSTTIPVTVTGGDFDAGVPGSAAANLTASSNAAGQITGILGTTGFGYRSQATLTIGGGGTGAVVRANFNTTMAPLFGTGVNSGTTLTSGGTGYVVPPTLEIRGYDFNGEYLEATAATEVLGGSVIDFSVPVTTFARITSAIITPQDRTNAFVDGTGDVAVSTSGGLTDQFGGNQIDLNVLGSGYNPAVPPTVTVRDLRGGGSGAVVLANTDATGFLDFLSIQSRGSAYSRSATANFPQSPEAFTFTIANDSNDPEDIRTKITVRPGLNRILDVHYGTGARSREID